MDFQAIRDRIASEVGYSIICHAEDTPIKGNALASGSDVVDAAAERAIERDLDSGNEWAWCTVEVRATWQDLDGSSFLGCCSYSSENSFIKNSGYFDDMKQEALAELVRRVEELQLVQNGEVR